MRQITYGVTIEFTVDGIIEGGPSRATIRKTLRELIEMLSQPGAADPCWRSLRDVRIKYLHEATSSKKAP